MWKMNQTRVFGANLSERSRNLIESGAWADGTFLVGRNKEEVKVVKCFLAIASPVFQAMFVGGQPERKVFELPNVELELFRKILQFIYSKTIDLKSFKEAFDVFEVARNFVIPELDDFCLKHLEKLISYETLCTLNDIFNYGLSHENETLRQQVLKRVVDSADSFLLSPEVRRIDVTFLEHICEVYKRKINSENMSNYGLVTCIYDRIQNAPVTKLTGNLQPAQMFNYLKFLNMTSARTEVPLSSRFYITRELLNVPERRADFAAPQSSSTVSAASSKSLKVYMERDYDDDKSVCTREVKFEIVDGNETVFFRIALPLGTRNTQTEMQLSESEELITVSMDNSLRQERGGDEILMFEYKGASKTQHRIPLFWKRSTESDGKKWFQVVVNAQEKLGNAKLCDEFEMEIMYVM